MDVSTILASISDRGYVRYMDYCCDLTEQERQALAPYLYWKDSLLWLTVEGITLATEANDHDKRLGNCSSETMGRRTGSRAQKRAKAA